MSILKRDTEQPAGLFNLFWNIYGFSECGQIRSCNKDQIALLMLKNLRLIRSYTSYILPEKKAQILEVVS